jgi:CBS domain-containing protein
MGTNATQMLVSATMDFLRRHVPFDRMEPEVLLFLAERLKLAYYAKDTQIVTPEMGVLNTLYILQRGKVLARQAGDVSVVDYTTMTIGPGEGFPIGSVTAQRPSTNSYIALDDVFCYELPVQDFFEVMQRSPAFNLFCTKYIASLLNQSRQQLQVQFAQRAAEQQTMNSPLASIIKKTPVTVSPQTAIRQVVEIMAEGNIGSMIIVDEDNKPIGIFTQSDVLKRIVLPGVSLEDAISTVMSAAPHALSISANAYDAALAMATHGIRHVMVVDEGGKLKGVISERDLFTLQRVGLRQIRQSIDNATDIDMLCQASTDVRQLALNMLAQGVGAEQLTQFISALNDTLTRRIIQLNVDRHDLQGIEWAWLSFGSEGRDEQTFSTDQDNGIVYLCNDQMDCGQAQQRLLDFARDVNVDLDKVGFTLCKGNIMASNPDLCLTLDAWEQKFADWVRIPDPNSLLNATIFFDFRPLYGAVTLAHQLRVTLFQQVRGNPLFMRMMAQNALSVLPPLGKIRDFITDADPEHPGTIDLKKFGARLFIDAARIFSLAKEVANTNTVQRLKLASAKMNVSQDEVGSIIEGFNFIQLIRLRHQHFEQEHGRPGDNFVKPDELNELERRILKESFRQVRKLQQRLKLDYQT